jgi:hypothetical protein
MSRSSTLIVLGVVTLLVPFSGLPIALRSILIVALGASVAGIGLLLRSQETARRQPPSQMQPSEPTPPQGISPI